MIRKLSDVTDIIAGYAFKSKDFGTDFPDKVIKITHIVPPDVDMDGLSSVDMSKYDRRKLEKYIAREGDYVFAMTGATIGKIGRIEKGEAYLNQRVMMFKPNSSIDKDYLYYALLQKNFYQYVINHIDSESAQPNISAGTVAKYEIDLPDIETQRKIGRILRLYDKKIETNRRINKNLTEQVFALYDNLFSDSTGSICRADEFFNITIGKTPPRKEPEWFSEESINTKWVSISDMGNCGLYISDSSEYLVPEAISKFNVTVVPDNTVLLSFKLTVGRIAITDGSMTTNEAIAHFKTDKKEINPYLYCYLKRFNFQTLGSTSSIATAINSKIVKAMPFVIPSNDELAKFNKLALPSFEMIKSNLKENQSLSSIRDSLLPKLMSGEIDVSDLSI